MSGQMNLGGAQFTISVDESKFVKPLERAKKIAEDASKRIKDKLGDVDKSSRGAAQGLLALSQAVDDAQYGFRAIVNNIPQMIYMFGGGAGLAGGIGIAAVAVNTLITHWESLINSLKAQWLNVPFDQLEKLRIQAEKAGEAFDKIMAKPGELQGKEIGMIEKAITNEKGGAAATFKAVSEAVMNDPALKATYTDEQKGRIAALQRQRAAVLRGPLNAGDKQERVSIIDKELRKVADELAQVNRDRAKAIVGGAILPGEQGDFARNTLRRLAEQFPKIFSDSFRKAMGASRPDVLERDAAEARREATRKQIEEQMERNRMRNRATAGQMLGGPLGTEVMLGGGGNAGPAGRKFLEALTEKGKRRFGAGGRENMIRSMIEAGLTEEQARQVVAGMNPRATFNRGVKIAEKAGVPMGPGGRLPRGALEQAVEELTKEQIAAVKRGGPGGLQGRIGKAMDAAGALGDPKGVMEEMRAIIGEQVKALMLEKGVTEQQAKMMILQDQARRAFPMQNLPPHWAPMLAFSKQIMTGGGLPQIAQRQLEELMAIRAALAKGRVPGNVGLAAGPN